MTKRAELPESGRPASMAAASHSISKPKPKIRIIHIFAPEIIKTEPANFRHLVQRLTGKPPPAEKLMIQSEEIPAEVDRKPEIDGGACGRVKDEEDEEETVLNDVDGMWNDVVEMEGFIQNLGQFPLLSSSSAHQLMHGFGETQFL